MKLCVFDVEANGLNPSRIWCLTAAIHNGQEWVQKTTTDYDKMRKFFNGADVIVGHNIKLWDIPTVESLLNIKVRAKVIDTLALSWYLYPSRKRHGLEEWGSFFGTPKPEVIDWNDPNLIDLYKHRCQEDVKINCKLWDKQLSNIKSLYKDRGSYHKLVDYLMFKMDCAREAEKNKWRLDVELCNLYIKKLTVLKDSKVLELKEIMPTVKVYGELNRPTSLYKKDGELSVKAIKWLDMLELSGLQESHTEPIEYLKKEDEPNPNSTQQVKDYLLSIGWIPEFFKKGVNGNIPQVRVDKKGEKVLCPSVKKLFDVEPKLEALEGLTILTHRLGILTGFMESVGADGFIKAEIGGFANTLRLKHRGIVNLPSVSKPYGDMIRGVLIASDSDHTLLGSDMAALENRTAEHYMYKYDKEYVLAKSVEGFDSHTDMAVIAGLMTSEEEEFFKWYNNK